MEKKSRRRFSSDFKAKVALETIQERMTISELSQKYGVHPNMIMQWKKTYKENGSQLFCSKGKDDSGNTEKLVEILYRQIGELKVANDFLKKKLQ